MASKVLKAERFTQIINQQMEILREERDTLKDCVDEVFSRVQKEVDTWINGGHVNQTTWAEMNNTIQQHLTFLLAKSVELSGPVFNESDGQQASLPGKSTGKSPKVFTNWSTQTDALHCCEEGGDKQAGENSSHILTRRLAILEEAVYSLKKTTEKVQKDQEEVDSILKEYTTQQKHIDRRIQSLSDSRSKYRKNLQEKITKAEKVNQANSLNIDTLKESFKKHDSMLNGFKDASKAIDLSINELNKQLSLVKTSSDCTSVSLQELSKKVESTNEQNDETSDKINKIENSINMMSSLFTEQFENMRRLDHNKFDDLIGMVCQLLAKRLTPLETLNKSLNLTNIERSKEQLVKKESIESCLKEMSKKVSLIELKSNQPSIGFGAEKVFKVTKEIVDIKLYDSVECNDGGYFDQRTGIFTAPLNGLYLISIGIGNSNDNKDLSIKCIKKVDAESVILFKVTGDKTLTRCTALKAKDKISLELLLNRCKDTWLCVILSCCLITR